MSDILCIVPDSPYTGLIQAIQRAHNQLGIGCFTSMICSDPGKDPGVYKQAHIIARSRRNRPPQKERFALALLDLEGSNAGRNRIAVESLIENNLSKVTFANGCCAVCVEPELEALFLEQPASLALTLQTSVSNINFWITESEKKYPNGDYEERMLSVLSSHRRLTKDKISFREVVNSTDYSLWMRKAQSPFDKLISTLQTWFPA